MLNNLVFPDLIRTEVISISQMRKLRLIGVWRTLKVAKLGLKARTCDLNPLLLPQCLGGRKLGAESLGLYVADAWGDCLFQPTSLALSLPVSTQNRLSAVLFALSVYFQKVVKMRHNIA